jgi:signal peptidase II
MIPSKAIRLIAILLVLVCTVGCDQAVKHLARVKLSESGSTVTGGGLIEFTLAENPGAFLSLGATLPPIIRGALLTVGVAAGLACLLAYLLGAPLRYLPFFGLVLAWAGGISNLIDRLARNGLVTDFMVLRLGPLHTGVFNLADIVIVTGFCILLAPACKTAWLRYFSRSQTPRNTV